jgi:hypothetical protein
MQLRDALVGEAAIHSDTLVPSFLDNGPMRRFTCRILPA